MRQVTHLRITGVVRAARRRAFGVPRVDLVRTERLAVVRGAVRVVVGGAVVGAGLVGAVLARAVSVGAGFVRAVLARAVSVGAGFVRAVLARAASWSSRASSP
ncbi:hypothetical protein, partial [Amycolatopsis plumensis]